MKEAPVLEYAQLGAKNFIPGAEVLRDTNEIEAEQKEQGILWTTFIFLFVS